MLQQQYPSQLLERAVQEFSKLPGIGRKTALRLVLHLLRQDTEDVMKLADAVSTMKHEVKYCQVCHNISDSDMCPICSDPRRDNSVICVVENIQDVMAVENTQQFNGLYHVLGGVISPMDGIGPSDLEIESLVERVSHGAQFHDGGRHDQFLYLPKTGTLYGCEVEHYRTRYLCRRRTGVHGRGNVGTLYPESYPL